MGRRLDLHEELCELLGSDNVYFQPPESKEIEYDCIVYRRSRFNTRNANNNKYMITDGYEIELIYRDPDNTLPKEILRHFCYCSFDRHFVNDNLYHDTFNIYY